MANAINTGSTLSRTDHINKTSTSISTNIIITVNDKPVGAVQSLQISEKRSIKQVDEVGTDGHVDSVPNQSTNITGTCQRIRFDRLRIAEAFGRGFVHVASQVYPFDIVIFDKQKRDQGSQISTIIKNVWIEGIEYTYQVSDWVISESMTWQAENIFSILSSGNAQPVATGGERGLVPSLIKGGPGGTLNVEQLTDTGQGGRRGSLDAAGLIDIGTEEGTF